MFRRNFRSSRRRSFSRFRGKRLHHAPRKAGRYQRGNFFLTSTNFVNAPNQNNNIVLVLAKISEIIAPVNSTTTSINEAVKNLDIGGIKFKYVVQDQTPTTFIGNNSVVRVGAVQTLVCSDRLDQGGLPEAITTGWNLNTTPTALASAQSAADLDSVYPTRVHWRNMHLIGLQEIERSVTTTNTWVNRQPNVRSSEGSANLKLRLRLDDEHGLTFHHCFSTDSTFPTPGAEVDYKLWLAGSIWYRFSF